MRPYETFRQPDEHPAELAYHIDVPCALPPGRKEEALKLVRRA
jgi:hypothetical protein